MADQGSALVVWGSTGRRLQFSLQDLKMPENLHDDPHANFYEKQWDHVAGFWFNRVLKESSLQHLEVSQIVELIRADIAKRWERRRQEQSLHKKRKRLLQGGTAAGTPSRAVLLTNVVAFDDYATATAAAKSELAQAVVTRVADTAKEAVAAWDVLVDVAAPPPAPTEAEPTVKKARPDSGNGSTTATDTAETTVPSFDDRVAVVCVLSSNDKAAQVIAHLHGSKFDGRSVLCRFWETPS